MSLNCLLSYYIILPSYRVRSQMFPQIVCPNRCIVALVVGYTCVAFLQCEFSNVRSHHLPWQKKTYIGYIWKIFSWMSFQMICMHEQTQSDTGCICKVFHQNGFSSVSSSCLPQEMHSLIVCICIIFHQNEFCCGSSIFLPSHKQSYWSHLNDFSPEWHFKCIFKESFRAKVFSHWLHLCGFSSELIIKCFLKSGAR